MGVSASKSSLERRNSVIRRSQRKSIHGIKQKASKLLKDIRKFKGAEEDSAYVDLKARIEAVERELRVQSKNLQPQTRNIHNEATTKIAECRRVLEDKLDENRQLEDNQQKQQAPPENEIADDDVFLEEEQRERTESSAREYKVVRLEQVPTRHSVAKIGVPVMPLSMLESLHHKTVQAEARLEEIKGEIAKVEEEINSFVGRKNGKHYNLLEEKLQQLLRQIHGIHATDDTVTELASRCTTYVSSCLNFLQEKADGEEVAEEQTLSPKTMRTTYI